MSDPNGPVTPPEQPEPAPSAGDQPVPARSAVPPPAPAAVPPAAAAPPAPPAPPAPRRGTGFTILVAAVTALVVALVVGGGTAFAVARHVCDRPHRVTVDVGPEMGLPGGAQRPDGWSDQRRGPSTDSDESGSKVDGQHRRGSGTDSQDGRGSSEQGSTDQESQSGS